VKTSERLRADYSYLWEKLFQHPFVLEMGDGSLPLDKFQFYVKQDYYFLIQYSRVLAIAAAKARTLYLMGQFSDLLIETINTEMDLHRSFAEQFSISNESLEYVEPAPVTEAYTDYLLRVAYEGSLLDIIATLLPCQWGYSETGKHLKVNGNLSSSNKYLPWIEMYSSKEFEVFVENLRNHLDDLVDQAGATTYKRVSNHFLTATRYEYLFWDMSYNLLAWPV
jgi:thiaminase/transcriptional activator TenA